ncbi:DUF4307 domain-containing protein [Mycolicibacillus parakoreensis]|uniref:DUF4307 domain-containing protein n=1 Tax=Mycolicibacillus parakoreensis TaxID=1069221 RepID=A0ABY3U7Y2_9MYCO|nr:DUF4307 domain-containing protein [Mycolicibacillus parakoreensis]MCV7315125.1 DUF4307 domain-containing protein [Mycolicibacillus parakoreensis]ULN53529.1 DUF4307 domain-containing protein [Mycolicibacillus parakoreensis]
MTEAAQLPPTPPPARYGRQRRARGPRRRVVIAVTVLAIAAGTVIAVVGYQRFSRAEVSGKMVGYELLDDRTVAVTISVTRLDPSTPVQCIVRARAKDGGETGRREVLVPASSESTVVVTTRVTSSKPPVVGDIYGCGTDVPGYLRAP